MSVSSLRHIEPQHGAGFLLRKGQTLRVVDPNGEQVSDLLCFNADDPREWLSSGRTLDYAETTRITTGHKLYSNRSNVMMEITLDDVGRHDFLLTPCSQQTFEILYGTKIPHRSCYQNLVDALTPFGIAPDAIPTTLNLFMNVEVAMTGKISVLPPLSRAGDRIELIARMDLIVGLTACSAEMSNNYRFKPIDFEVLN